MTQTAAKTKIEAAMQQVTGELPVHEVSPRRDTRAAGKAPALALGLSPRPVVIGYGNDGYKVGEGGLAGMVVDRDHGAKQAGKDVKK